MPKIVHEPSFQIADSRTGCLDQYFIWTCLNTRMACLKYVAVYRVVNNFVKSLGVFSHKSFFTLQTRQSILTSHPSFPIFSCQAFCNTNCMHHGPRGKGNINKMSKKDKCEGDWIASKSTNFDC